MMKLAVLALATMVAGCDDSIAIEIRVPDGIAAEEVELFLGVDRCQATAGPCEGIGAKDRPLALGTVYDRDSNRVFRAPVSDGVAEFKIAADDLKIPVIIAIGQPADPASEEVLGAAQLLDVDLSAGATRYIETLEPVDREDVAKADAVLWRRADTIGCAGFRARNAEVPTFVVAQGDPDCDDFVDPNVECDELVWHGRVAMPGKTCVTHGRVDNEDACTFGTPACVDGVGPTECAAGPTCIPERLCDCESAPDPVMCVANAVANTPLLTHVRCEIPFQQAAPDADWVACPNVKLVANLDGPLLQRTCLQPELLIDNMNTYDTDLDIVLDGTHAVSVHVNELAMPGKCNFDLVASGNSVDAPPVPQPSLRTIVRMTVPATGRILLVPIDLAFDLVGEQNACPAAGGMVQCTFDTGPPGTVETIDACAR